jgi:hypothetical protein
VLGQAIEYPAAKQDRAEIEWRIAKMSLTSEAKGNIIKEHARGDADTGSRKYKWRCFLPGFLN